MTLLDFLYTLEPRHALAVAIGISIVLFALAANLAWANQYRQPSSSRLGRFIAWATTARLPRTLGELARWLYYLALPWATLMLGYNTVRALGVWRVGWLEHLADLTLLGLGAAIVLVWVWRPYAHTEHPHALDESGWNRARRVLEMLYQEAHWAFYRSGPILWLGDFYWGSFFGLGLTLLEGGSNPYVRARAQDVTRADAPLWTGSLAIVSTIVFIFTQNSWYCLLAHLLLDLGLRRVIGFPRAHDVGLPSDEPST